MRWLIVSSAGHWSGDQFEVCLDCTGWLPLPGGVIAVAVRWYLRYALSYRDVEELLSERDITVDQ